jgi:hypothetical protein
MQRQAGSDQLEELYQILAISPKVPNSMTG